MSNPFWRFIFFLWFCRWDLSLSGNLQRISQHIILNKDIIISYFTSILWNKLSYFETNALLLPCWTINTFLTFGKLWMLGTWTLCKDFYMFNIRMSIWPLEYSLCASSKTFVISYKEISFVDVDIIW